jgi:diadenosine tetraphosphate (Ap4A) HIT family hydrolase
VTTSSDCPLCIEPGGALIWQGEKLRVIQVDESPYPGYCRIVWQEHVREMSDLSANDRALVWAVLDVVERAVRAMLKPDKMNLASLGNQVPHLHWHVIPRWRDDQHFPDPIWAAARRVAPADSPEREANEDWSERQSGSAALAEFLRPLLQSSFPW